MSSRTIATLTLALGGTLAAGQRPSETTPPAPGATAHAEAAASSKADEPPAGLSRAEWSQIRGALEASSYHAMPLAGPGQTPALVARNRRQRYRTEFRREGIEIVADPGPGNDWRLGLSAAGVGYEGDVRGLPAAGPQADLDRVEYRRGPVTEWYVNRPEGLEQGFTIAEPAVRRDQPLVIELAVSRGIETVIEGDAAFLGRSGVRLVRYDGLKAWDRDGRDLPARLDLDGARLLLIVDTAGARFPVTVDPTFVNEAKLVGRPDPSDQGGHGFGQAVSISGDTVVVGAPAFNTAGVAAGSAYVFVRSGTSWTQQTRLEASDGVADDNFGTSVSISGATVVVGAFRDHTPAGVDAGSAYVFVRAGTSWTQQAKLQAPDGSAYDSFGVSVSIGGDTIVVGSDGDDTAAGVNAGSAYVFVRAGTSWTQQAKLQAADGAESDLFGSPVAISGDTVVVGSDGDDTAAGVDGGSAYVFVRSGTSWSQQAKLQAADGTANDHFGASVSISSDTVVAGAVYDGAAGDASGSAYVFVRSGTSWSQQAKLLASDGAATAYFGGAVSVSEDTVVVGAGGGDTSAGVDAGSAYVFVRTGTSWAEQAKLVASDGAAYDHFGGSVSVEGGTIVSGAEGDDETGGFNAGSAYVFVGSGSSWAEDAKLLAGDWGLEDYFGQSVSISGDTVVVGAYGDDTAMGADAGSAYVFARSGTSWTEGAKLWFSEGSIGDGIGSSVSISGDTVVVGAWLDDKASVADTGSAYVFVRSGMSWIRQARLLAADGAAYDGAGMSVSISGDTVVVGAFADDTVAGTNAGSAYVFVRTGTSWAQQAKLQASDGAANDCFGLSVSIEGDTVVVGAYGDDAAPGIDTGSAYVFVRSGTSWAQQAKLVAPDGTANDRFGLSVSISGDTVVVGAPYQAALHPYAGSAYVFVRSSATWTQQAKLLALDGTAYDMFGVSVTIEGDTIVAGASLDETAAGPAAGSAYVFRRSGTTWTEQAKVLAPDGAVGDDFGWAVAISGDTIVVGADWDDTDGGVDAGSAYVFRMAPADLGVSLSDSPDPVSAPGAVTHTIGVSNAGPSEATNVRAVLSITSAPATGVSLLGTSGLGWSCSAGGASVTCTRPSLASGASAPPIYVAWGLGPASGTLLAQAVVSATEPDPQAANNTAVEPTTVNGVPYTDLGVSTVDSPDPVAPAGALTYTVQVSNLGPQVSTGMTVTDALPGGVTFASSTPGSPTCTHAGGTVTCHLPGLAPSASHLVTVEVTLNAGTLGTILNAATVAGQEADPVLGNNSDTEATVVGVFESELGHGSALWADLESVGGAADEDLYRIGQTPYSSYEVVVDGTSGDIGVGEGPRLERLAWETTTVLQSAVPAGAGPSRSLRWENDSGAVVNDQYVRVRSAGCATDCGPEDVYRIRSWDTTLLCPRFNNSATQVTVLLLQNTAQTGMSGHAYFWSGTGVLLGTQAFSMGPKAAIVVNTSMIPGLSGSGSITLSHDGPHGTLVGKAVALEPATGFAFDTPVLPRAR